jgi:hypothetical protein
MSSDIYPYMVGALEAAIKAAQIELDSAAASLSDRSLRARVQEIAKHLAVAVPNAEKMAEAYFEREKAALAAKEAAR